MIKFRENGVNKQKMSDQIIWGYYYDREYDIKPDQKV